MYTPWIGLDLISQTIKVFEKLNVFVKIFAFYIYTSLELLSDTFICLKVPMDTEQKFSIFLGDALIYLGGLPKWAALSIRPKG